MRAVSIIAAAEADDFQLWATLRQQRLHVGMVSSTTRATSSTGMVQPQQPTGPVVTAARNDQHDKLTSSDSLKAALFPEANDGTTAHGSRHAGGPGTSTPPPPLFTHSMAAAPVNGRQEVLGSLSQLGVGAARQAQQQPPQPQSLHPPLQPQPHHPGGSLKAPLVPSSTVLRLDRGSGAAAAAVAARTASAGSVMGTAQHHARRHSVSCVWMICVLCSMRQASNVYHKQATAPLHDGGFQRLYCSSRRCMCCGMLLPVDALQQQERFLPLCTFSSYRHYMLAEQCSGCSGTIIPLRAACSSAWCLQVPCKMR